MSLYKQNEIAHLADDDHIKIPKFPRLENHPLFENIRYAEMQILNIHRFT